MTQSRASREGHFIEIRKWHLLVHYADRVPVWIKVPVSLLDEDAYLALSGHERAVLHGLWLERAALECAGQWPLVSFNRHYLSRRLGLRVTFADLEALSESRFIEILDSETGPEGVRACTH